MGYIYILIDPITDDIRYVGQTKNDLLTRLNQHIRDSFNPRRIPDPKEQWIIRLSHYNLKPRIEAVQELPDYCLGAAERYWFNRFKDSDCPLLNEKILKDYFVPDILLTKKAPGFIPGEGFILLRL